MVLLRSGSGTIWSVLVVETLLASMDMEKIADHHHLLLRGADHRYVSNMIDAGNGQPSIGQSLNAPDVAGVYYYFNETMPLQTDDPNFKPASVQQLNSSSFYGTQTNEYDNDTTYSYYNCAAFEGNTTYLNVSCETILNYSLPLYGYCIPVLLVITLAANSLIIIILKKRTMASPTNFILMGECRGFWAANRQALG
uniref:G-protein coupled receptors family 1 profile domain-containing protein n=1 Tax=Anopheles culicifacies TaxID=139723 RepID=A0A182MDV7_9DIPT